MGVLRAARERSVVGVADRILQRAADGLPAFPERRLARPPEGAIGEVGCTKPGKADQPALLVQRRRPLLSFDLRCDLFSTVCQR